MKKVLSVITIILCISIFAIGCSSSSTSTSSQQKSNSSKEKVMTVDKNKKEIKMIAQVNGKYFTEPTRHAVVSKNGSNGEKSVLRGLADEKDFYNDLISIGAKPGNNVKKDDMNKGVKVKGSKLNVFITWDGLGKEIPFSNVIKASNSRPADFRFGGNIENAKKFKTGCILCLDSCPVGIVSNAAYAYGESNNIKFYGNKDVLPKDGTKVTVIFRLAQ